VGKSSLYAFYIGPGGGLVHLHWGHLDPDFVASVRGGRRCRAAGRPGCRGPELTSMLPSCFGPRAAQGAAANLPSLEFLTADTPVVAFDPVLKVGLNESLTDVSRNAQMLEWSSTAREPAAAALPQRK